MQSIYFVAEGVGTVSQDAALQYTKTTLVSFLKAFLANYDNYKGFCDRDFSNTAVYVESPMELRSWPMIVISGSPGQMITAGLSDFADTLYNGEGAAIGYRFSGIYQFTMQVDIAGRTTVERDQLVDLIALTYRLLLRRYMEARGVLVVNMNYGGQAQANYNSDPIYLSTLNFTTWSEWSEDIPFLPPGDNIRLDIQ